MSELDNDKLYQAILKEISVTRNFFFQPSNGTPRVLVFNENNEIQDPQQELTSWSASIKGSIYKILLKAETENYAILEMDAQGIWRGRSRQTSGPVVLTPQPKDKNNWPTLANPTKFYRAYVPDDDENKFTYKEHLPPQINWEPYRWNISEQLDKRTLRTGSGDLNTAIAIVGCDRTNYFKQVVQSVALNPESKDFPVFIFLDLPIDSSKYHTTQEQIDIAQQYLSHAVIIKRKRNFGCGRNLIDVRRQLFDSLNYDNVFIFEDDLVISPQYITVCLSLLRWGINNYSNIGAVQAWNECKESSEIKAKNKDIVRATTFNWWGYLLRKVAWDAIKTQIYKFEDLFLGGEYSARPHNSISEWFRIKTQRLPKAIGDKLFPLDTDYRLQLAKNLTWGATGQDGATAILLYQAGWTRITTHVNRAKYIGKNGIHMNSKRYDEDGYDLMKIYESESDRFLSKFCPVTDCSLAKEINSPVAGFSYIDNR